MKTQRLLVTYNFSTQPYSVGDVLTLNQWATCFCIEQKINYIDWIFTYDVKEPIPQNKYFTYITKENFKEYVYRLFPLAQINPYVKNILLLNHQDWVAIPKQDYICMPDKLNTPYMFYMIFEWLTAHHKSYKGFPCLSCDYKTITKMRNMFGENYVSVQLRKNKLNPARNSIYPAWREFFKQTKDQFVIVGEKEEVDGTLDLPNVFFSKNYNTSLVDDLAIIQNSRIHMGASSGPGMMAIFSNKPYIFYNSGPNPAKTFGFRKEGTKGQFSFAKDKQYIRTDKETLQLLIDDYKSLL